MEFCIFLFLLISVEHVLSEEAEYTVTLKSGIGPGSGTDALFNLTFVDPDGMNVTFLLDGSQPDRLEKGKSDTLTFNGVLVYPIDHLLITRVERRGWSPDWYLHYLTLDVNSSLYAFRVNRWIRDDKPHRYYSALSDCYVGYRRIQECRKVESTA